VVALGACLLALGFSGACATTSDTYSDADSGIMTVDGDAGGTKKDGGGADATTGGGKDSGPGDNTTDGSTGGGGDAATCVKDPPSNMCGVAPQCGCGVGETCDVQSNGGDVACIASGTAAQGKACTTTAGCAQGLSCAGNVCRPYCPAGTADAAACGLSGTTTCVYVGQPAIPNFHVCGIACDLVSPTACDPASAIATVGCVVDDKGNTDCQKMGANTSGQTCTYVSDCAPGFTCVGITFGDGGTASECEQWCKVGTANACPMNKTCSGFQTKVIVGGVEYGSCS
jgi:hypothetical protein